MQMSDLRIALFSGNYNMTTDGANRALNRLVEYLLRQGAQVRVYSPTIAEPAFAPTGDLVSLPSLAIPGRSEYLNLSLLPYRNRALNTASAAAKAPRMKSRRPRLPSANTVPTPARSMKFSGALRRRPRSRLAGAG